MSKSYLSLKKLEDIVSVIWLGNGLYKVRVFYHGKTLFCRSNNSLAFDRIKHFADYPSSRTFSLGYTLKQAYLSLYRECLNKNVIV